jgi:hypothetical protein
MRVSASKPPGAMQVGGSHPAAQGSVTTGESSERIASYRALAPICKPGVAEATAENYYREHTGNEEPRSIDDAILVTIHGDRAKRKAGEQWGEG